MLLVPSSAKSGGLTSSLLADQANQRKIEDYNSTVSVGTLCSIFYVMMAVECLVPPSHRDTPQQIYAEQ